MEKLPTWFTFSSRLCTRWISQSFNTLPGSNAANVVIDHLPIFELIHNPAFRLCLLRFIFRILGSKPGWLLRFFYRLNTPRVRQHWWYKQAVVKGTGMSLPLLPTTNGANSTKAVKCQTWKKIIFCLDITARLRSMHFKNSFFVFHPRSLNTLKQKLRLRRRAFSCFSVFGIWWNTKQEFLKYYFGRTIRKVIGGVGHFFCPSLVHEFFSWLTLIFWLSCPAFLFFIFEEGGRGVLHPLPPSPPSLASPKLLVPHFISLF